MDERPYMPFFKNYLDAAMELPYKQGCELVFALCYTGLTGKESPHKLTGAAAAVYAVAKPNLITSFARANSGSKGGSKTQANYQANSQANSQANAKQNVKLEEEEKEEEKYFSEKTIYASKNTSKAKKDFTSQYVRHGEVSPLMKDAAERLLEEDKGRDTA